MNYAVKNDNPDVGYSVEVGEVLDAEGEVVPDESVSVEVSSSDPAVVEVIGGGASGSVHFGHSGNASVSTVVKDSDGNILASGGDNFTVTVGDPASVSGVSTSFEGLSPIPDPIPEPEPEPEPEQ